MIRSMDAYDAIGGPIVPGHSIASMSSVEWMLNGAAAPVDGQEAPKTGTVKRVRKVAAPATPGATEPKGE